MKKILIFVLLLSSFAYASDKASEKQRDKRAKEQLKIEMEKEKKYSREQTFYNENNYDFKGAEVNPDSLHSIEAIEVDDFNIDSVYD